MPLHKDLTGTDLHPPGAHKTQHENGGSDEISVAGLSGTLADPQPTTIAQITDATAAGKALLDDADAAAQRTTLGAAAASHNHAAGDINSGTIATARLGSGTADNTTFLRGDQTWQTVSAGAAALDDLTDVDTTGVADGDVLTYDSGSGDWIAAAPTGGSGGSGTDAGVRVYHNAAQSIAHVTGTALAFNSERYDTGGFHDPSTNNSRLTVPSGKAGKYVINGNVEWATNGTNARLLLIQLNGTTAIAHSLIRANDTGGTGTGQNVTAIYDLAVGDYVELVAYQDSGGALNIGASGNTSPEFSMQLLSAATAVPAMVGARVYHNAAQSSAHATGLTLAFNSERYDTNGFHDTVTNNSRLTVPTGKAGYYLIGANVEWATNGTNVRLLQLSLNGTTAIAQTIIDNSNGSNVTSTSLTTAYPLVEGDYVVVIAYQDSGDAVNINSTANVSPEFWMHLIGT